MYALGYSLDNLSLMGLTIAVGFVVDDAIVMVENIARHIEMGKTPMQAALDGAGEIGFTILSISISLVAVFIPLLLMGGMVGRMFQEFAVTVTVAIVRLGAGVADAHADDGCPTAAPRTARRAGACCRARWSGSSTCCSPVYDACLGRGAAPSLRHADGHARDRGRRPSGCSSSSRRASSPSRTPGLILGHDRGAEDISPAGMAAIQQQVIGVVDEGPRGGQRRRLYRCRRRHRRPRTRGVCSSR